MPLPLRSKRATQIHSSASFRSSQAPQLDRGAPATPVPSLPMFRDVNSTWLLLGIPFLQPFTRSQEAAFFCSNRHSHRGCGRTFSILWSHLITRSSIASGHLLELITGVVQGLPLHRVWHQGSFPFSITTAYRWLQRWQLNQAHLRSHLSRTHPPPRKKMGSASRSTLLHLSQAYPNERCRITAFQEQHQQHLLP